MDDTRPSRRYSPQARQGGPWVVCAGAGRPPSQNFWLHQGRLWAVCGVCGRAVRVTRGRTGQGDVREVLFRHVPREPY